MKVKVEYDTEREVPDQFRILETFSLKADDGFEFQVTEGLLTDGASIPDVFQSLIHPIHRDFPADAFHDGSYMLNHFHEFSRLEIDRYWLQFMKRFNPRKPFRTYTKYAVVRLFGWYNWRYYKYLSPKQQQQQAFD